MAKYHNVWEYVDPHNDDKKEPDLRDYKNVEDIDEDDVIQDLDEMTDDEFESYILQIEKRQTKKIASRMTTVHAALRMTAEISAITCTRDVVKALAARFDSTSQQKQPDNKNVICLVDFLDRFPVDWFNDEE